MNGAYPGGAFDQPVHVVISDGYRTWLSRSAEGARLGLSIPCHYGGAD
jgi:hypothetical protein